MVVPTNATIETTTNVDSKNKRLPPSLNLAKAKQATDEAYAATSLIQIQLDDEEEGQETVRPGNGADRDGDDESSGSEDGVIDLDEDLARLDQLRKNVKKNLKLRPITSAENPNPNPESPSSTTSAYFTPLDEQPSGNSRPVSLLAVPVVVATPPAPAAFPAPRTPLPHTPNSFTQPRTPLPFTPRTASTPLTPGLTPHTPGTPRTPFTPQIYTSSIHSPQAVSPAELYHLLSPYSSSGPSASHNPVPLTIDTRPLAIHSQSHIRHSVPIAIPSLILKRSRSKKGAGVFINMGSLRQFITTEHGMRVWDALVGPSNSNTTTNGAGGSGWRWNGNVIIYDQDMEIKDRTANPGSTPWALLGVVQSLLDANAANPTSGLGSDLDVGLEFGKADYLKGGIGDTAWNADAKLRELIVNGGEDGPFGFDLNSNSNRSSSLGPKLPNNSTLSHNNAKQGPSESVGLPQTQRKPKLKGPPPALGMGLGGGLFQLDTHQAGYKTRGQVLIDQSLSSAGTSAGLSASAGLETVRPKSTNPFDSTSSVSTSSQVAEGSTATAATTIQSDAEANSSEGRHQEKHVLSSVPDTHTNLAPSPLPMMPSFSIPSSSHPHPPPASTSTEPPPVQPSSSTHLFPPVTHLSIPSPLSGGLSSGVDDSAFTTAYTSMPPGLPSPGADTSAIGIGGAGETTTSAGAGAGQGFKRPAPPANAKGLMNKRPSAPNLRTTGLETEISIPPPLPNSILPLGSTPPSSGSGTTTTTGPIPLPGKRLPKLSLNTGGVGGLGVGGERGTWGTGAGSLGRKGGKLRSATIGASGGGWGDRDMSSKKFTAELIPLPSIPPIPKFTAEPESISQPDPEVALSPSTNTKNPFTFPLQALVPPPTKEPESDVAFSPTSNIRNPFQSLALPLALPPSSSLFK
ncbi:hypothetical protein BT96DRAFT_989985 [Gymnopus androsaceus JB14]|uniref:Uncharacterized protein n=1 Tax=Gymnopus androsaceus JB14 TaxID=1447944 RepID=A0A6A4I4M5_9AGAR|nr:hypothetical protein BT96DRAFT_989985 [Gymnopus androsaceus JB14]